MFRLGLNINRRERGVNSLFSDKRTFSVANHSHTLAEVFSLQLTPVCGARVFRSRSLSGHRYSV